MQNIFCVCDRKRHTFEGGEEAVSEVMIQNCRKRKKLQKTHEMRYESTVCLCLLENRMKSKRLPGYFIIYTNDRTTNT
jgi:hypothetical protein